jgi:hypothetical protein
MNDQQRKKKLSEEETLALLLLALFLESRAGVSAGELKALAAEYADKRVTEYAEGITEHGLDEPEETVRIVSATEVFTAAAIAEKQAAGDDLIGFVQTAEDELVCPVCEPLNGQPIAEVGEPSFHVGCRCGIRWERKANDG